MTSTSNSAMRRFALLTLLAASLAGCATTSPSGNVEPPKASPPNAHLMTPPRSLKASKAAEQDIKRWRETLNSTPSK